MERIPSQRASERQPQPPEDVAAMEFDPRAVIADVIQVLGDGARARQLDLAPLIYPNVPTRLRGDPGLLRQVLLCLTGNAIRFSEQGRIVLSLTCDVQASADQTPANVTLRFAVSDAGVGITPEELPHLFAGFDAPGVSGLTRARHLIEQMGGDIGVESAPGQGSTFWFTTRCAARENTPNLETMPLEAMPPGVRILVAEDEPVNQQVTLHHLAALGYRADLAADGEQVLAAFAQAPYDVVLMDCQMPGMDGYEATAQLRRRALAPRPIIIALTSHTSQDNRDKCLASGMDDFLSKPVQRPDLASRLRQWMQQPTDAMQQPRAATASASHALSPAPLGQPEFEAQLIRLFLDDAPTRIAAMQAALSSGDARALEKSSHTLKSSSGLLGAAHLAALCEALETQGEAGILDEAADGLRQLEDEFARVRVSLEEKLTGA